MNTSEQLLNDLIATLEQEIADLTAKEKEISFSIKVKKSRLKKLKTDTAEK